MRRRKRGFQQFSLSFLDCMSCGLGAVILLFMVINHSTEVRATDTNRDVADKVSQLESEVLEKRQARQQLAAALEETERQQRAAKARAAQLEESVENQPQEKQSQDNSEERIAALSRDLKSIESEVEELRKQAEKGDAARTVAGEGNRQYLTGLKVQGRRILILVDTSASMLADTILEVIRRRNMDPSTQRNSPKWRRALSTVDWITSQMPASSQFQVYGFNTEAKSVLSGTDGSWQSAAGGTQLTAAVQALRGTVPSGGTSLVNAFAAAGRLSPAPDSIFLIIDSLPTQGEKKRSGTVDSNQRINYYRDAIRRVPGQAPVNVILFPMEGDPLAPSAYWQLAQATGAAFLSPSEDWP